MMSGRMLRKQLTLGLAVLLAGLIAVGAGLVVRDEFFAPRTITAYFPTARALYQGDDVRVLGVKVGTVTAIEARATDVKLTLRVDHGIPVSADAKAIIVAPNLLAARYVQLTPAYSAPGSTMPDGAVIPIERTAVPVEWDEVKTQLMRLATDLGPSSTVSTPAVARFIDSAADAMGGNGDKLRQTITQLSQVGRILADGSGNVVNVVDIIKNLQTFVSALSTSAPQIVVFENRLATLTSVVNDSKSDLDAALKNLSTAVVEVQRFVKGSRDPLAEGLVRLNNVTQNLVDNKTELENVLHLFPNIQSNTYNTYNPDIGGRIAALSAPNFASPLQFICDAIGAVENVTATETAKLCAEYLSPALRLANPFLLANLNYLPIPVNPYLMKSASPGNIIYSDPALAPGGAGGSPVPPELPPAVSAYTGLGDVPPPAGYGQPPTGSGLYAPDHLPAVPSPALFPGAPIPPGPAGVPQMLLPEAPTGPPPPAGPAPTAAGTP
jgi:phospholipid/cholesterol/gamma-HCH transport system substrate-binding protein